MENTFVFFGNRCYLIESLVNSGGYCDVYSAKSSETGERFVYRELRDKSDENVAIFGNGVNVLKMLNSMNMWRFPKLYSESRSSCLREFIVGRRLSRHKRTSEQFALSIAYHAADGLEQFGRIRSCDGVTREPVNRDIKPDNILVSREGDLYIIDVDTALTNGVDVAEGVGTPRYRSPEQQNCEDATPKSDIFSLGLTLYQVFVGNVPGHDIETKKIDRYRFRRYRKDVLKPALGMLVRGRHISEVIKRCLRENGEYESAEEMREEVKERMKRKGLSVRDSRVIIGREKIKKH